MILFELKLMTVAGKQGLKCSETNRCAVSFLHLKLKRGCEDHDMEVEESQAGMDYRIVNTIMCSDEGGYT